MKKLLPLLFLLLSFFTYSQVPWTLEQCLDTALKRNITVNQSRLANELNKTDLEQSKAQRFPSVNANVDENFNFGKNVDLTTNTFVTESFNSTNAGINSGLNLFSGFQVKNSIRQAKLNVESGKYDIEKSKNDLILGVTSAYLQVLFSNELYLTAKSQEEATNIQVDRTQKLVNSGKVAETNLLQIRAQLATDHLGVVNAANQLSLAKVNLMQLMEIPVKGDFDIVKPALDEPSGYEISSNEDVYKKSLDVQPQIAGAALKTQSADLGIKISEGARWPKLNLSASINSNYASSRSLGTNEHPLKYPFYSQMWDNLGQSVGLSLSIPIYSNRQIKSNIERSVIGAMSARLNEQDTRNQLRKTIEQTINDLQSSYNKYNAAKEQLANADASYRNLEKKFNVGLSTAVDFLIEKNNFYQAESNLIQAKYDYFFKTKILDFYQGKSITF